MLKIREKTTRTDVSNVRISEVSRLTEQLERQGKNFAVKVRNGNTFLVQYGVAKSQPEKKAVILNEHTGAVRITSYQTHKELMCEVWDLLYDLFMGDVEDNQIKISLPEEGNLSFYWNAVYADYCFGKGSISEERAFEFMSQPEPLTC